MKISIIAAMDKNGLIGKGNDLPWHFSEDLNYFKEKTMGKYVIMGQRTYQSIGKPLLGRNIIVLSKEKDFSPKGVKVAQSIKEALSLSKGEVMIAGGASVYRQFLEKADTMYLTFILEEFEGDIYFPQFRKEEWEVVEEKRGKNPLLLFQTLKRINKK